MSKFEDHLWREFVREHGDALPQVRRPTAAPARRARPRLMVGTGLGLAGAGGVIALLLGATATSPAFAVTPNRDGTVTVRILRSSGIAGANARLRQLGIRATVMSQPPAGCTGNYTYSAGEGASAQHIAPRDEPVSQASWHIPATVPKGHTLVLTSGEIPAPGTGGTGISGPPPAGNSGDGGNSNSGSGSSGEVWSCPSVHIPAPGTSGGISGSGGPPPGGNSGNSGNS